MCKSRLFWWQTQKKCVKQSFKSFTNLSSWVYFGHIYSCVYVCACVYECIGVYLCVFVCICVNICICVGTLEGSVWGCGQSDDSSKERTVELLTSRVDHFVMLTSRVDHFAIAYFRKISILPCSLQSSELASWWLFIQGQCFLLNQSLNKWPTLMFDLD